MKQSFNGFILHSTIINKMFMKLKYGFVFQMFLPHQRCVLMFAPSPKKRVLLPKHIINIHVYLNQMASYSSCLSWMMF